MPPTSRSSARRVMQGVARELAAVFLAVLLGLRPVMATPPTGRIQFDYYTMTIDPDATDRVQIRLPKAFEYEEDALISRTTRSPSVFLFMDLTTYPNYDTGWHYHPGVVLFTVVSGEVDWYDGNCVRHVLKRGDHYVENNRALHWLGNSSTAPARLILTFIIKKGITYKIDAPAPSCAAALGLK